MAASTTASTTASFTASTTVVTWALPLGAPSATEGPNSTFWASIINADSTATTFAYACTPDCDDWTPTMTIGPWAQTTPPPTASTGVFDLVFPSTVTPHASSLATSSIPTTQPGGGPIVVTYSVHCGLASTTVAISCAADLLGSGAASYYFEGGNRTLTGSQAELFAASLTPVTVTAGGEKLAARASTTAAAASVAPGGSTTTAAASGGAGTGSATSASASAAHSGAASSGHGAGTGVLGLLGLVAAFLVR